MGVTIKTIGNIPVDRNIARVEIFCEGDARDAWRIVEHFQDAPYDGDTRVMPAQFGTERVDVAYGAIKGMALPGGAVQVATVADLFPLIRGLGYALRQAQIDKTGPFAPPPQEDDPA